MPGVPAFPRFAEQAPIPFDRDKTWGAIYADDRVPILGGVVPFCGIALRPAQAGITEAHPTTARQLRARIARVQMMKSNYSTKGGSMSKQAESLRTSDPMAMSNSRREFLKSAALGGLTLG